MAKGSEVFEFEFLLCDVIPINVYCVFRFGQCYSVTPKYQGQILDIREYLFDEENDFISLEEYLEQLAQQLYDEPLDVILELDGE